MFDVITKALSNSPELLNVNQKYETMYKIKTKNIDR